MTVPDWPALARLAAAAAAGIGLWALIESVSTRDVPRIVAAFAFLAVLIGPVVVAVVVTIKDYRPRLVFGAGLAATAGLWGFEAINLWLNGYDETPRALLMLVPLLFLGITLLTLLIVSMVIDSFRQRYWQRCT